MEMIKRKKRRSKKNYKPLLNRRSACDRRQPGVPARVGEYVINMMIPGSKGHKSVASLLAGEFMTLGPAKNMSKEPFFEEK